MSRVGEIHLVYFRYYDITSKTTKTKSRPFLIIKEEEGRHPADLTCLPISTITNKSRINVDFDIEIDSSKYPLLNLNANISYIRTHKIQTINEKDLYYRVCVSQEKEYGDLYIDIKDKVKKYYGDILSN